MKLLRWSAIILFLVFVFVLSLHSLNSINQDIGRHLKSGQIIWETKNVYKTNLFSYTEPGHRFINHHWLSEVVFYLLNCLIGLKGLIIFKAGIITSAFLLLWLAIRQTASVIPFLTTGVFGLLIFSSRTDVRPEIFSYLFLSYFLFAILRAKYSDEIKWLYPLPIVQIFWTNMHIYFGLGPMLLFLFWIDRKTNPKFEILNSKQHLNPNDQKDFKFRILNLFRISNLEFRIFTLTTLATLINPNFIKGALAPLTILRDYGYSIVENQNIFFLTDYGIQLKDIYIFELSLAALILSFVIAVARGRRKITFEFLAALVFMILAGKMIRNFGPYALVFTSVVAINLSRTRRGHAMSPPGHTQKISKIFLYGALTVLMLFLIKSATNNKLYQWLGSPKKFGLGLPIGAQGGVDFVKNNRLKGPVFNNFDVGSFLIWKLYPVRTDGSPRDPTSNGTSPSCPKELAGPNPNECGIFVDGRPEAYSVEFFSKIYKPMQTEPLAWQKKSQEYNINYIFFDYNDMASWAKQFLNSISTNPDWPMIYLDNSVVIFIKRTPENQELIQKFQIKP